MIPSSSVGGIAPSPGLSGGLGGGSPSGLPGGVSASMGFGADPAAQRDFADLLGIAQRVRGGGEASAATEARDTAERFVATTFVQPLLDRFSEMSEAAPPFQRTEAERTFGTLLNGQMALEVVRKGDWAVVDQVASGLLERPAGAEAPDRTGAEASARTGAEAPGGRTR